MSQAPILLTIKVRTSTRQAFVSRYYRDVVAGGLLLRTGRTEPPPLGARLRFRFQLESGIAVLSGEGRVCWVERGEQSRVGIRFEHLSTESEALYREMLARRRKHNEKTLLFEEVPTRPMPRVVPPVRLSEQ